VAYTRITTQCPVKRCRTYIVTHHPHLHLSPSLLHSHPLHRLHPPRSSLVFLVFRLASSAVVVRPPLLTSIVAQALDDRTLERSRPTRVFDESGRRGCKHL
jgi:hypothetical protein